MIDSCLLLNLIPPRLPALPLCRGPAGLPAAVRTHLPAHTRELRHQHSAGLCLLCWPPRLLFPEPASWSSDHLVSRPITCSTRTSKGCGLRRVGMLTGSPFTWSLPPRLQRGLPPKVPSTASVALGQFALFHRVIPLAPAPDHGLWSSLA